MVLKQDVLKYLIENKDKEFTIRQISKYFKKDYKNTYNVIKNLLDSINLEKKVVLHLLVLKQN